MKLLSLTGYLSLIWGLLVSFCLAPSESLALETTQYARVVAQAERIAYLAAQRSALASQVATAALAPSASSFAIRLVAGPVGWAALGVGDAHPENFGTLLARFGAELLDLRLDHRSEAAKRLAKAIIRRIPAQTTDKKLL